MRIGQTTNSGFTLIELVITIVLTAILFSTTGVFISQPIRALSDISKRSVLVDSAELALRRMERDISAAVPNSIRVSNTGSISTLEILNVVEGMRYRSELPTTAADVLDFGQADTSFNVMGQFVNATLGSVGYRVVIYNTGAQGVSSSDPTAGANVYATSTAPGPALPVGTHVITPTTVTVTLSNPGTEGRVTLSPGFQFALQSPRQRLYIVDTPVSYVCDSSTGVITRYANYDITSAQPTDGTALPLSAGTSALLANKISACSFTYQPGTSQRNGIATLDITLTDGTDSIRLLQQVSVSNAP